MPLRRSLPLRRDLRVPGDRRRDEGSVRPVPLDLRREEESGPDPHFHRTISEQFYVLAGEVRLYDGRTWMTAHPGDFLYVPEGGIHGFRGSGGASMLLLFAPGGPREDYFETLARGELMTDDERTRFMETHDTHWL